MNMPVSPPSDTAGATSVSFAAEVDRDVFFELLASFDEASSAILHVEKAWPTRHVYFLRHPAGLFFLSEKNAQDFRRAHVIDVKKIHFSFPFHF